MIEAPLAPVEETAASPPWEVMIEAKPPGLVHRLLVTYRHLGGILAGGLVTSVRSRPEAHRHGFRFRTAQLASLVVRPLLRRDLSDLPFPVQFRRRLEILGPTYIKLGQVLSLREDLLPKEITDELKNLLDRLPVLPFPRYCELIAERLHRPVSAMFEWIDPAPLGSASIGQTHRARTVEGEDVIIKLVKPGIPELLKRDAVLLRAFAAFLQTFLGRFQPRRVIGEFVEYTSREVDLRREASNAETFAANFKDLPDVVFPKVYRKYSSELVMTQEFLPGKKPSDPEVQALSEADKDRLIDLGAAAIVRMLYQDGFFHADLHPGNLMVLPGPKAGFIDLGMVGRFDHDLRRSLLYYFYCLVMGDAENSARYLAAIAQPGRGADPQGFRKDVQDISISWAHQSNFADYSLAQLIMESVGKAAKYRMYFPVELVLMVKALVTFEGVGQILKPGFDVAQVSQKHVNRIFLHQFSPVRIVKETLAGAPEIVDALVKAPMLITEGLRVLEQATKRPPENPFTGIRGTIFAGFCLLSAAMLAGNQLWIPAAVMAVFGLLLALRPGK
ncbi:MAG TPA: AarF/UbiB family protein [Thermoanaerobaculia bacterium]|nr:AarF/UbiB family protein [Thermoanaerobaculia bacterium]